MRKRENLPFFTTKFIVLPKKLPDLELREFLEEKYKQYNTPEFIVSDPISIPHLFSRKEDIEIAGLLTATISWGQRVSILKNGNDLMGRMDMAPFDFVSNASAGELTRLNSFVHRTFNGQDLAYFISALRSIYKEHNSLEAVFTPHDNSNQILFDGIHRFRTIFLSHSHPVRLEKHVSNPSANSAAKRLCMFLRWMVRKDEFGVDFGIWKNALQPKDLMCPLDVHSGNVARKLGILRRKQNDWKAVVELTDQLKKYDSNDPVKYDFALFGLGVFEKF